MNDQEREVREFCREGDGDDDGDCTLRDFHPCFPESKCPHADCRLARALLAWMDVQKVKCACLNKAQIELRERQIAAVYTALGLEPA